MLYVRGHGVMPIRQNVKGNMPKRVGSKPKNYLLTVVWFCIALGELGLLLGLTNCVASISLAKVKVQANDAILD